MSKANDRQVGGTHYKGREYQHWDFVTDIKLPYLLGVATKYVSRYAEKNGAEDLEKALHYIDKAEERGVYHKAGKRKKIRRFAEQHAGYEGDAITAICRGDYAGARFLILNLIKETEVAVPGNPMPAPLG